MGRGGGSGGLLLHFDFMESTNSTQFPAGIGNEDDQYKLPPRQQHRVMDEMDFFNRSPSLHDVKEVESKDTAVVAPPRFGFDVNTGLNLLTSSSEQSATDDGSSNPNNMEDGKIKSELASLQAAMERTSAENDQLKEMLNQVTESYQALQIQFLTLIQQQQQQQQNLKNESDQDSGKMIVEKLQEKKHDQAGGGGIPIPRQFMDLGPAETDEPSHTSSDQSRSRRDNSRSPHKNLEVVSNGSNDFDQDNRRTGREESPDHASQGNWVANKLSKLNHPSKSIDQAAEATMRKARVSVRARSEAAMITDGCQWRKYGQKMAKGNPCPRAYYRCTMATGCPVRKQVQRCAEDRSILITTYEGNHNHPLPPAAMAMAQTTSTAASMLLSGSMSSADGLMNSNFLTRTLLPCSSSSMATISASAPFPTVTLDLTHDPNPLQFQKPPTQFHVPFLNPNQNMGSPPGQVFGQNLYNQSKFSGLQMSQGVNNAAQFSHQAPPPQHPGQQSSLADTVSAATAAITADPNFATALAAAISSIIGGGHQPSNNSGNTNHNNSDNSNGDI